MGGPPCGNVASLLGWDGEGKFADGGRVVDGKEDLDHRVRQRVVTTADPERIPGRVDSRLPGVLARWAVRRLPARQIRVADEVDEPEPSGKLLLHAEVVQVRQAVR